MLLKPISDKGVYVRIVDTNKNNNITRKETNHRSHHKGPAIQQSLDNRTTMLSPCLNYKLIYLYRLIDECLNYHVHLQSISTGNIYSTTILRISSKETVSKWLVAMQYL
jgi:hypothetical protein